MLTIKRFLPRRYHFRFFAVRFYLNIINRIINRNIVYFKRLKKGNGITE